MTGFTPPYPHRPSQDLAPLELIKTARRDILAIWPQASFSHKFSGTKIINRWIFIANSPETVKHVLITHNAQYQKKTSFMRKTLTPLIGNSLLISDGADWHKHRKQAEPKFNSKHMPEYAQIVSTTTQAYIKSFTTIKPGANVDISSQMRQLSAQIHCRYLFGSALNTEQTQLLIQHFAEYQTATEQLDISLFFGLPAGWLPGSKSGKAQKTAKHIQQIIEQAIEYRTKNPQNAPEFTVIAELIGQNADSPAQESLTTEQIRNELIGFYLAGQETTANTLAWAWYLISQCPDLQQQLHSEVDSVLAHTSNSMETYEKLAYTRAIIDETLRLYPPMPFLTRIAQADDQIGKRHIPAGSIMVVAPWLLHRHPLYWEKPDSFNPARFLPSAPVKPTPLTFLPYSVGARECLAKQLGSVQMTLALATLAKQYTLTMPPGTAIMPTCRFTLKPNVNLMMQIKPRQIKKAN